MKQNTQCARCQRPILSADKVRQFLGVEGKMHDRCAEEFLNEVRTEHVEDELRMVFMEGSVV